ncbi:hypothetical protein ACFX19_041886 [Malus domestica]
MFLGLPLAGPEIHEESVSSYEKLRKWSMKMLKSLMLKESSVMKAQLPKHPPFFIPSIFTTDAAAAFTFEPNVLKILALI